MVLRDLRYAARSLSSAPSFTIPALLTLALSIGANSAIFSIADALLWRPLPYPAPGRLLALLDGDPENPASVFSAPKFFFLRDNCRIFAGVGAYEDLQGSGSGFNLVSPLGDGAPERIQGSRVTAGFFRVFGVQPFLGRGFSAAEDRPGGPPVVVLSHSLWRRRFASDAAILGRQLRLNGTATTVVGVMPSSFLFPSRAELWVPYALDPSRVERANRLHVAARLEEGTSLEQAASALRLAARQFGALHPDHMYVGETFLAAPLRQVLFGGMRRSLLLLLAGAGLVLAISCGNISNLQLTRATAKVREVAIRTALGASARRVARLVLMESLVLGVVGGGAGLALGAAMLALLSAVWLSPIDPSISIDGRVVAFSMALATAAAVASGMVPAWIGARSDPGDALREAGGRSVAGAQRNGLRRLLVASQVAVALVLLTGAALLLRSLASLLAVEPGFKPDHLLTMKLSLAEARYGAPERLERLSGELISSLERTPGVARVAAAMTLPLEAGAAMPFSFEGGARSGAGGGSGLYRPVTPEYFSALGVPTLAGRTFSFEEGSRAPLVAVINRRAARLYWPSGSALGERIRVGAPGDPDLADPQPRTVIGVVEDVRESGLDSEIPPIVYVPLGQMPPGLARGLVQALPLSIAVRLDGRAGAPVVNLNALRRAIGSVDREQPISDLKTMSAVLEGSLSRRRSATLLLGAMAALGLVLAGLGIYGVLSYLVEQRTHEIGVRMALGATTGGIVRLVVREGFAAVVWGVVAGLAGSLALTRLLRSLLFEVSPQDPSAYLVASGILAGAALFACLVPALRASHVSPVRALTGA